LSERLPSALAVAVLEFVHGDLLWTPRRVGHELQRELLGSWSARRGSYRILYEIHDEHSGAPGEGAADAGFVRVVDVDHRRVIYYRRR
jgi:mRNA interferase RelE/StbE